MYPLHPRSRFALRAALATGACALIAAGVLAADPVDSRPSLSAAAANQPSRSAPATPSTVPGSDRTASPAGVPTPDTRRSADARTADATDATDAMDAAANRPGSTPGAAVPAAPSGPPAAGTPGAPAELAGRAAVPVLVKGSKAPRSGNLAPRSYAGSDLPSGGTGPTTGTGCGGSLLPKAGGGYWTCSFDDEFDGSALDRSKWVPQTTAASGFTTGVECFMDSPGNIAVSGGTLKLTVRKESAPLPCSSWKGTFSSPYTAGMVMTYGTFAQTYGRFEVRAKLPPVTVKGLQETFWLWPQDPYRYGAWPYSGEIDFGEFYSATPGWNIPYMHYAYDKSTTSWATDTNVVTALPAPYNQPGRDCRIDQFGYNTYTLIWLPGRMTIQVNGKDCIVNNYVSTNVAAPAPFDAPFFLALTQGIGIQQNAFDPNTTPLPATTEVDYVRIWK